MNPAAQPCPSCGFDNPRAWRACSRCGHPLGLVKSMTGRTYLSGADATVVTAAPVAFWNGSGMSALSPLGHSSAAPSSTATPVATSSPTTTLAASGPTGEGPLSEWE